MLNATADAIFLSRCVLWRSFLFSVCFRRRSCCARDGRLWPVLADECRAMGLPAVRRGAGERRADLLRRLSPGTWLRVVSVLRRVASPFAARRATRNDVSQLPVRRVARAVFVRDFAGCDGRGPEGCGRWRLRRRPSAAAPRRGRLLGVRRRGRYHAPNGEATNASALSRRALVRMGVLPQMPIRGVVGDIVWRVSGKISRRISTFDGLIFLSENVVSSSVACNSVYRFARNVYLCTS